MSPNDNNQENMNTKNKMEQLLTNYFHNEMPDAIRQLPDADSVPMQTVAAQQAAPKQRSLAVAMGLIAATAALVMVVFAIGLPFGDSTIQPSVNNPLPDNNNVIVPVDDSHLTQPVEMQKKNSFGWVKKVTIDPETGERTERLEPEINLNIIPDNRIMIPPFDDDELDSVDE